MIKSFFNKFSQTFIMTSRTKNENIDFAIKDIKVSLDMKRDDVFSTKVFDSFDNSKDYSGISYGYTIDYLKLCAGNPTVFKSSINVIDGFLIRELLYLFRKIKPSLEPTKTLLDLKYECDIENIKEINGTIVKLLGFASPKNQVSIILSYDNKYGKLLDIVINIKLQIDKDNLMFSFKTNSREELINLINNFESFLIFNISQKLKKEKLKFEYNLKNKYIKNKEILVVNNYSQKRTDVFFKDEIIDFSCYNYTSKEIRKVHSSAKIIDFNEKRNMVILEFNYLNKDIATKEAYELDCIYEIKHTLSINPPYNYTYFDTIHEKIFNDYVLKSKSLLKEFSTENALILYKKYAECFFGKYMLVLVDDGTGYNDEYFKEVFRKIKELAKG